MVKIPIINNYIVLPNSNIDLPLYSYCFSWFLIIFPICYYCLVHLWLRFALVHLWVVELHVLGGGHVEDVPSGGRTTLRATSSRIFHLGEGNYDINIKDISSGEDNFDRDIDINIKDLLSGGWLWGQLWHQHEHQSCQGYPISEDYINSTSTSRLSERGKTLRTRLISVLPLSLFIKWPRSKLLLSL